MGDTPALKASSAKASCGGLVGRTRGLCITFSVAIVAVLAVGIAVSVAVYYHVRASGVVCHAGGCCCVAVGFFVVGDLMTTVRGHDVSRLQLCPAPCTLRQLHCTLRPCSFTPCV